MVISEINIQTIVEILAFPNVNRRPYISSWLTENIHPRILSKWYPCHTQFCLIDLPTDAGPINILNHNRRSFQLETTGLLKIIEPCMIHLLHYSTRSRLHVCGSHYWPGLQPRLFSIQTIHIHNMIRLQFGVGMFCFCAFEMFMSYLIEKFYNQRHRTYISTPDLIFISPSAKSPTLSVYLLSKRCRLGTLCRRFVCRCGGRGQVATVRG